MSIATVINRLRFDAFLARVEGEVLQCKTGPMILSLFRRHAVFLVYAGMPRLTEPLLYCGLVLVLRRALALG